ncbi:12794_t:CDS:2 [Entrophospora sp. SA101]|nr:12794_t:CDS:2 [Entrophospora sp. SA101]CAJ0904926.1 19966_t:CDS:2 [Entrophospora sp. SA101]
MYYDQEQKLTEAQKRKKQQKKPTLMFLLLAAGAAYLFLVYLPQEKQKKQLEAQIQADIDKLQTAQPNDYVSLLTTLQVEQIRHSQELVDKSKRDYEETMRIEEEKRKTLKLHWQRKPGIALLKDSEELFFTNKKILEWERKILINPTRGDVDPTSGKDNNALFYGAPGTGKTSITKRICLKINQYPMIELKVDNFGFERVNGGEVRYILFVDEANQINTNTFSKSPSYLVFLKECMEGVDKTKQSQNLWIFATNYLNEVDKAVYRPALPEIKPENATEQQPAQADDKLEDIVSVVRDTIDMRIDETNELLQKVGNAINNMSSSLQQTTSSTLEMEVRDLQRQVADLRARID